MCATTYNALAHYFEMTQSSITWLIACADIVLQQRVARISHASYAHTGRAREHDEPRGFDE